jgi:hypothetical protein
MNRSPRVAIVAATIAMVASACGGSAAVLPSQSVPPTQVALAPATPAASPSPVPAPSQTPSPGPRITRITVAGSGGQGSPPLTVTADLPPGWSSAMYNAGQSYTPPAGIGFFLSVIDDTFATPCKHAPRDPKVGSTVAARAAALGKIPGVSATAPVQTTLAGREATYVELTVPASLPCPQFTLWQDSPGNDWYAMGPNELWRVWILDVGGQAVALTARSFPGTTDKAKAELQSILDSMVFEGAS